MEKYLIKCTDGNELDCYNDFEACDSSFIYNKDELYSVEVVNYFGEHYLEYYTVCPNCGHIVMLDKKNLSEEDMIMARIRSSEYNSFRKNKLKGELIHLDYLEELDRERIKRQRTL